MLEEVLLKSHALAGALVLFSGVMAIGLGGKGGKRHRLIGKVYFWAMFWIFFSALLLLFFFRFQYFLLAIAVFSFYMAFTGYRGLYRKRPGLIKPIDRAGMWLALLSGIGLFLLGLYLLSSTSRTIEGTLCMIFGFFSFNTAFGDFKHFGKERYGDKRWWWYHHMSGMLGSFIAALTAFLVQNGEELLPFVKPIWLFWLLPTLIGLPMISFWVRKYKKKFRAK